MLFSKDVSMFGYHSDSPAARKAFDWMILEETGLWETKPKKKKNHWTDFLDDDDDNENESVEISVTFSL